MVRVGGGWDTLEHYLDKHDPCRCSSAGQCWGERGRGAGRALPRPRPSRGPAPSCSPPPAAAQDAHLLPAATVTQPQPQPPRWQPSPRGGAPGLPPRGDTHWLTQLEGGARDPTQVRGGRTWDPGPGGGGVGGARPGRDDASSSDSHPGKSSRGWGWAWLPVSMATQANEQHSWAGAGGWVAANPTQLPSGLPRKLEA